MAPSSTVEGDNSMPTRKNTTKESKTLASHQSAKTPKFKKRTGISALTWRGESNGVPHLSMTRARDLVREILAYDDDAQAAALVELITGIAYELEATDRDSLALMATHESFALTSEFSNRAKSFATWACTRSAQPLAKAKAPHAKSKKQSPGART
jgi:hypothetical protein